MIYVINPFFWHMFCSLIDFVLLRQQYWADGLNVFRRRMCPPDFFILLNRVFDFVSDNVLSMESFRRRDDSEFLRFFVSRAINVYIPSS